MRVLLDECVHAGVKAAFSGHTVRTVTEIGLRSSKDGALLDFAQSAFDVFVTIDRNLDRQHNLKNFNMGFVIVRVPNNELASYRPIFDDLKRAAETVGAGESVYVISPTFRS